MSLSRLWQLQSKRREAHHLLAAGYGRFIEGFDTADLQDARTLLNALMLFVIAAPTLQIFPCLCCMVPLRGQTLRP